MLYFFVVGRLLVRQNIAERSVGAQVETANLVVNLADGAEGPGDVHVGFDVDGLEPLRELAGFLRAIVFLDVFAGASDGEQIEEFEIIKAEHVHQLCGLAVRPLPARASD